MQTSWVNLPPIKWTVFIKLYPMSKARMLLSKILPQTFKKFTPDLQKIYTDISVISVTLCNSGASPSVTPNNPPNNPPGGGGGCQQNQSRIKKLPPQIIFPVILQEEGGGHTTQGFWRGATPHKAYLIHVLQVMHYYSGMSFTT